MASFIQTGDPNAHKVTNASVAGVPRLNEVRQLVVSGAGPRIAQGNVSMLEERCAFWLEVAEKVSL